MTKPVILISKLGTARRVPKSRIWIEGKRLVDAGFTVGKYFHKDKAYQVRSKALAEGRDPYVILTCTLAKASDICTVMPCKVSGKGEKPIIDITGELVRELFSEFTHVEVRFKKGVIEISGHGAP